MYFVFKSALTVVTLFPEIDLRMRFFRTGINFGTAIANSCCFGLFRNIFCERSTHQRRVVEHALHDL